MEQYLVNHAMRNVWGNPDQDSQYIFQAARITPDFGVLNYFQLMNRKVALPVKGKYFHVYQIGQLNPSILGFTTVKPDWVEESWVNIADAIEPNKVIVSLYTKEGAMIPRFQCYYLWSNERNLVIAVERNDKLKTDFNQDELYFRVYSNAWFMSQEASVGNNFIRCKGKIARTTADILAYQTQIGQLRQQSGYVFCFVNGFYIDDISPLTVQINDTMEYVFDSSVKRVVTFNIRDTNSFNSVLDNKRKYLLHYNGVGDPTIDYEDDVDVFVLSPLPFNRYKGYYYNHNTRDSKRMVTHRDYSIVADYFDYIARSLTEDISPDPIDLMTLKLQLVIRKSGSNHNLIYDNSRIFEMYKLPDDKIVQAMIGVNSNLDLWRAGSLENNAYTKIMRQLKASDITLSMVQEAYGYNSISKIVGDTPIKTTLISNRQTATLPEALIGNCTVYEYDVNGYFLGYYYHTGDRTYQATNNNTRLIEALSGQGTNQPDVIFGQDNIPLPTYDNYRVYMCYLVDDVPNNQWRDITGSDQYSVVNNVLKWNYHEYDQFLMVRTDKKFLAYTFNLAPVNGNLFFTFAEMENRGSGLMSYVLPVPLGEIDIIMNGKSLIKGLDYVVNFPMVHIVNKEYLIQPGQTATQSIHVRMTGFCTSDLEFEQIDDFGFIQYGYLSDNNRYDIRDDKVLRITVGGKTMDRSDLVFSEEHDGVSVANPTNGTPYQVKDIIVPLKQLVNENTYTLRAKSQVIDQQVSNYMTIKKPEPDRGDLDIIPRKYEVISPFLCRVLAALQQGEITNAEIEDIRSDADVIMLCQPYESVLAFDPVNEELEYDYDFVAVHPHRNTTVINVTLNQYKFLSKVVSLYCHGVVALSPFFTVSS